LLKQTLVVDENSTKEPLAKEVNAFCARAAEAWGGWEGTTFKCGLSFEIASNMT
jgi:hypothetical protein